MFSYDIIKRLLLDPVSLSTGNVIVHSKQIILKNLRNSINLVVKVIERKQNKSQLAFVKCRKIGPNQMPNNGRDKSGHQDSSLMTMDKNIL